jgi:hydrogenase expression/formation protein HypE
METPTHPGPALACPTPISRHSEVTIGHGGGGKLTQDLIDRIFRPAFASVELDAQHDGAVLGALGGRLAFTTDAHVVSPLFFPGGNIGTVAVCGTVNDLAMCGARPLWLSAAFILEEGFPIVLLEKVATSMAKVAAEAGVRIVTGDTKVVERGKGDGVYITTAGVGLMEHQLAIGPSSIRPGDAVLLSGDIGRHGMAILASREGLSFESPIQSDCAPLAAPVLELLKAGLEIHCLRDLTRGGLATALIELAESSRLAVAVDEALIPVDDVVRGACEILGLEPCYVANEGRFVCILPESQAGAALEILRAHAKGSPPVKIGSFRPGPAGTALLRSVIGADRILDRLSGEQLPRIC